MLRFKARVCVGVQQSWMFMFCYELQVVYYAINCGPGGREVSSSSPEWVPVFYEVRSTAHGLPEPSLLLGSTWVPKQRNINAVTIGCNYSACKVIDGCSLKLCLATPSLKVLQLRHPAYATQIKVDPTA